MDKRGTKHSIPRSSLFASPSDPQSKKYAKYRNNPAAETVTSFAPSQSETTSSGCDVEPMEVDTTITEETVTVIQNQINDQKAGSSSTSHSSSSETPRRKSIPAVGKRRSICFPKEVEKLDNPTDVIEPDQSTVFELLMSDSELDPTMQPLKRCYEELKALEKYDSKLSSELEKYDQVLAHYTKKRDDALQHASLPYLTQYKKTNNPDQKSAKITNFDDLTTAWTTREKKPIDIVLHLYSNFKKLTSKESAAAALQKEFDEEQAKNEALEKELELLKQVREKYRRSDEEKAEIEERSRKAKAEVEKSREMLANVLEMAKNLNTIDIGS